MDKELDDLDDLEELEDLEELPEPQELDELEERPELEELPGEAAAAAGGAAARSGPRELEKAPMMLQKAGLLLAVAAMFPWLVPAVDGAFPVNRTLAKLVILLGGYVLYLGIKHRHGESIPGPLASIGGMHKSALTILALVLMGVGVAPLIDPGGELVQGIVSKAAVAVGIFVWCQVQDYAKGGKFNPVAGLVIPMFAIAGLGRLATVVKQFDLLALIGSAGVVAAGGLAGYTMFVAMKEAKEHGKAKKKAMLEARKQQRQAKRNR